MHPLSSSSVARRPPLCYTIDENARTLVIELLAIDNESDLLASLQYIGNDPKIQPGLDVYVDCNQLRRIPSCQDVRRLARAFVACQRAEGASRSALIAGWRPVYDAARFFAAAVGAPKRSLRVFQTWSEARVWFAMKGA